METILKVSKFAANVNNFAANPTLTYRKFYFVFAANITLSKEFEFAYVVLLTFSTLNFNIWVVDHLFSAIAMLTQIVNTVKIIGFCLR